jgi:hypothetical protein
MPKLRLRARRKRIELSAPLKASTGRLYERKGMSPLETCRKAVRLGITKVVLAFSAGKDSLAGWLVMRDAGIEVVPVYKAFYPDLDLDRNTIIFYEEFFEAKIEVIPHGLFWSQLRTNVHADPVTLRINEKIGFRQHIDIEWLQETWKKENALEECPTALCIKKYDSAQRMMTILRKGGEISTDKKTFYPMANASDKMSFEILIAHNCPLPSFYLEEFESRDWLRITTMDWYRKHAKKDWEKIKFWQPLIEAEYYRLGRKPD